MWRPTSYASLASQITRVDLEDTMSETLAGQTLRGTGASGRDAEVFACDAGGGLSIEQV